MLYPRTLAFWTQCLSLAVLTWLLQVTNSGVRRLWCYNASWSPPPTAVSVGSYNCHGNGIPIFQKHQSGDEEYFSDSTTIHTHMLLHTSSVHSGSGRYFRVGGVNEEWVCKHAWTRESGGMLPRKMRFSEITSNAIIGLKTLLQLPFHKHFERMWLVVLIRILVWLVVQIQLFINCTQLQGFHIESNTCELDVCDNYV